ncbi:MAG: MmgE/PrpD family protein, partial [Deltaproteobacteria bacterium]|nr:MmgE/PrpD family protein [Deltaproteobacteria bacterium]
MESTFAIADFVARFDEKQIGTDVLDAARAAITDYTGVAIAGIPEKASVIAREVIGSLGGAPQASVWAVGLKTSMPLAAMANGVAAHAHDYDDTNPVMMAHPSIQLLPGLFSVAEHQRCSGLDLITAYVAGFEVGAKLGRAINPEMVAWGWFPVGVLGTIMQTAACAKLLRLEKDQIVMALGIAANLASGLRCNNGTMAKVLMAGYVGHNGIMAAMLARGGMTANPQALEDQFGYVENFSRVGKERLATALQSLGRPLDITASGLSYKLYPCCAGTHMPIDCALKIADVHQFDPDQIDRIN